MIENYCCAEVLRNIAVAFAETGQFDRAVEVTEEALKSARKIKDFRDRFRALREIAVAFGKAGKFDRALEIVSEIEDDFGCADALKEIVKLIAEEIKRLKNQKQ